MNKFNAVVKTHNCTNDFGFHYQFRYLFWLLNKMTNSSLMKSKQTALLSLSNIIVSNVSMLKWGWP